MLNFESFLNLPLIWSGIMVTVIIFYVLLDGFDLGVGILFPFAPSDTCRDKMMSSIAPFWDGNETWLIMGGGCLFAAFPLAYSIILPALYMPILLMLIALIFRGVAFEFRFKSSAKTRHLWDLAFHFGSLFATVMQGMILGGIVQGIHVENNYFAGSEFDWFSGFSFMSALGVVSGYVLLGSTWLYMKTCGETQDWARKTARYILLYVLFFMGLVSLWMPFVDKEVFTRWFSFPNNSFLILIPIVVVLSSYGIYQGFNKRHENRPFLLTIVLFLLGFVGLVINTWPYAVPKVITFRQAAAAPESLSLMLVGVSVVLPVILTYTAYSYYVFRGKVKAGDLYQHD